MRLTDIDVNEKWFKVADVQEVGIKRFWLNQAKINTCMSYVKYLREWQQPSSLNGKKVIKAGYHDTLFPLSGK